MAQATQSREELVEKLAGVFRAHGYEGATLTRLAQASGLVKASLYYQFPRGKEDMAAAVLTALGAEMKRTVFAPLDGPGSPREKLKAMGEGLSAFYRDGAAACVVDVLSIGTARDIFAAALSRTVLKVAGSIAAVLREAGLSPEEAGRRGEDALIAVQGSLVVARASGSPAAFRRVLAELPDRLLAGVG